VAVSLRPEKILLSERLSAAPEVNRIHGIVAEIAYLGDVSIYHVRTPGGRVLQAQLTNRNRMESPGPTWDQPVSLHWSATNGVVLEA
jgi:putrescine transport system ATP-binding protein